LRCTDAARAFRAWEQERRPGAPRLLPIYALTANVLEEHRLECEQAGMDSFATKPLRANVLAELRQRATAYAQLVPDARR
jgi:CheY-like chemotaxis protein